MSELSDVLNRFVLDSENAELNYQLALLYENLDQTAAAITYYLRAAERTDIQEHAYECLLRVGNCFNKQGNRANTVQKTYKQALSLLPKRPEAYLCLSKFFEINNGNSDAYLFADLGLKFADFNLPPLRTNVCYPLTKCYSGLLLEKAICSWGWGKNNETRELFTALYHQFYYDFNDDYKDLIKNNMKKLGLIKSENTMAHPEQREFVSSLKSKLSTMFTNKKVLDIGSLDINGSLRDFFTDCEYHGIDIGPGKGVDIVCQGQNYSAFNNSYDVVCSSECFEHNPYWFETFLNMIRVCKPDGLLFFTCATEGRAEHGTSRTDPASSPLTVNNGWEYYKNLIENDFTSKLNFSDYFSEWNFEVNTDIKDLYFWGRVKKEKVSRKNKNLIIDYFPFFAPYGEELLELRVSVLRDYVDYFVISESNKTHSGAPTDLKFLEIASKLKLPMEKIIYYPLDIPDDNDLEIKEIDVLNTYVLNTYKNYTWSSDSEKIENKRARVRERLQKDAILHVIDRFDKDDVIIHSDSDEIINPQHIHYLTKVCKENKGIIVKVPLILCEAQADLRVYWKDSNTPVDWSGGMFLATVSQLRKVTPTQIRSNNFNSYPIRYITENNQIVPDLGWHFSWMGGTRERGIKLSNFMHYNDKFEWMKNNFDSYKDERFRSWINETEFKDGSISPTGNPNHILKKISHDLLPKEIFENKKLNAYFIKDSKPFSYVSKKTKNTVWVVDNFYETPDKVREFALQQEFVEGGFGRGFIGRRTVHSFLFDGLKEKFEEIVGKKITGWTSEDNPEKYGMNGRFQIAWAGEPLVYHCDNQKWGGMLYLTPNAPYQCGTTLHAHKQTRARTYYDPGWDAAWNHSGGSHLDRTPWEPVDVLGNVYNRLVIFDASAIHSASEYFGNSKENARLWQMFFFDTE
jgi:SAM-dependent methyltransferase